MRTTLNIEDKLIDKASKINRDQRKDSIGKAWSASVDSAGEQ